MREMGFLVFAHAWLLGVQRAGWNLAARTPLSELSISDKPLSLALAGAYISHGRYFNFINVAASESHRRSHSRAPSITLTT